MTNEKAENIKQDKVGNFHIKSKGFTLIEILVVLVVLGMLASLIVPGLMGKTEKAKAKTASTQIQRVAMAVEEYYLDNGHAPKELEELVPGYVKPSQIKDPWGRSFRYQFPGENGDYDIFTYGADDTPGGEGVNEDLGNWQ
ncbi:MAG: type II secretion system protein GspG [Aestuariibacter sp.]